MGDADVSKRYVMLLSVSVQLLLFCWAKLPVTLYTASCSSICGALLHQWKAMEEGKVASVAMANMA